MLCRMLSITRDNNKISMALMTVGDICVSLSCIKDDSDRKDCSQRQLLHRESRIQPYYANCNSKLQ